MHFSTIPNSCHEVDGSPAVDLTILNNSSIADVDNPELIIRRGSSNAFLFNGIDDGDMVKISDLSGALYNAGLHGQYAENYDTAMFTPHSSYCHDRNSSVTGWGVLVSDNASGIDSDGGAFETPILCEEYKASSVSLLDDLVRSYETTIVGESYDGALSDGLTYNVSITDDSGVVDTYGYTIDANTTLGTGAIINAIYDNGVSDVTITDSGTKYSESTFARLFDLGAVSTAGSVETPATAVFTTKDGMIDAINVVDAGAGYQGFWNIVVPDGGNAHTHNLQLSQTEVNLIMSGTPVVSTTVEPNHSHDITISWNAFTEMFIFDSQVGAHDHGPVSSGHQINPSIVVTIVDGVGTGANASAYVLLTETNTLDKIVMTNSGENYDATTSITLVGGLETTAGTMQASFTQGGISTISMVDQGTGYTTNEPKTISVAIQNNSFSPAVISANIGDTISFTNLDIGAHTVTNPEGAFDSGNIPQNAVFSYTITQDTEITRKYAIHDSNAGAEATLWVRENTVFVDMVTVDGGGLRASGTVSAAGNLIDIAVTRPGKGYSVNDTVKIVDVSGPGEGAYATVETNRSINTITVENGGSGYSQETSVVVFDPTGTAILDEAGVETGRIYGYGVVAQPTISVIDIPGFCSNALLLDEVACLGGAGTWTDAIAKGQITEVAVSLSGKNYVDVELIINDPTEAGSGAVLTTDINNVVSNVNFTERGAGYAEPIIVITDPSGVVGTDATNTVGRGFVGTVELNNGIGGVNIVEDWHDYINGSTRVIVLDAHPEPTGFGAMGTASLGGAGNISNIVIDTPGSAYKTPVIIVAGPVTYTGGSINAGSTNYALFGPEGNTDLSPFSANGSAGTNFKNGVLVQWGSYQGHSLGDSWKFTLQSWKKGTPDSLVYESSRFNGSTNMMKGIITLKDIWDV